MKRAYRRNKLSFGDPEAFRTLLQSLRWKTWVVYVKVAMAGPVPVLRYLGRYTHRVAISNHRRVSFDGERITKDCGKWFLLSSSLLFPSLTKKKSCS
ncbi:MAG: transposase [Acidobacteriaceae bacterium]|nr:transposase [Acidobacteriaceae bacterium]